MSLKIFFSDNRRIVSGAGLVSLIPLLSSSAITALLIQNQSYFQSLSLEQWLPFFSLSILTMALAITPTTFIALVTGFFLGWQAAGFMIFSYLMASALGYLFGKSLDGGRLLDSFRHKPEIHQLIDELKKRDWVVMMLVRISPVLPFSLINLLLPATGLKFRIFVIAGFIGMLPRTLFSIWAGTQAQTLLQLLQNPDQGTMATIILILASVISLGGLLMLFTRTSSRILTPKKSN